jgi:hypothetical protein
MTSEASTAAGPKTRLLNTLLPVVAALEEQGIEVISAEAGYNGAAHVHLYNATVPAGLWAQAETRPHTDRDVCHEVQHQGVRLFWLTPVTPVTPQPEAQT